MRSARTRCQYVFMSFASPLTVIDGSSRRDEDDASLNSSWHESTVKEVRRQSNRNRRRQDLLNFRN